MPTIDASELLSDPDIAGMTVVITRANRTINTSGMTVDAPKIITTIGSILPASGSQLQQFPEDQRVLAHIQVIVQVPLIPLSFTNAPDLVAFNGQNYRVMTVQDYGQYGVGFWIGICQLTDTALNTIA